MLKKVTTMILMHIQNMSTLFHLTNQITTWTWIS